MLKFKYLAAVISVLLLCSCGQGTGMTESREPDRSMQPNEERKFEALDRGTSGPLALQHTTTPPLEGGTEKSVRPKSPANNRTLVRLFPNIMALNGPSSPKRVAITFDDGPDRRFTPQVLDILKKHDVKATFFLMGSRVKGLPEITERIHQEGHVIGNHSYWHPKVYAESIERMVWEVEETDKQIQETVGYLPKLFRAPYGGLQRQHVEKLGEMGKSVIGWTVDSLDWKQIPADEVQHNVLKDVHPGAIILMHCAGDWTQDLSGMTTALDELLPKLKEQGYELVTVPELLGTSYEQQE